MEAVENVPPEAMAFYRPQAVAALFELGLDALCECIGLLAGEDRGEVLHHDGIGVETAERLRVTLPPAPQDETGGAKCHDRILFSP